VLTELRVLLVHGLLHLVGFDHEQGEQQLQAMAQQEASLLEQLDWEGSGLISLVAQQDDVGGSRDSSMTGTPSSSSSSSSDSGGASSSGSVASSSSGRSRWVVCPASRGSGCRLL
jgi:hypothetical protein